ncbi:YccF domain-containing protein [Bailinhaonella thermotolerans]|uniref:YccF domain-containing protein n=1 Tax=Bailinhaonella thermotolerans TaxID=1070861 RepID=A0A3A4ANS5_9ACTN|nr:YccF domain-containing protein [Bailinhaonella thermotolerans]
MDAETDPDQVRGQNGLWVVMAGLAVVLICFVVGVIVDGDMTVLFGGLTGVVGTIIGAYFGIQTGQAGKERAEAELRRMNEVAVRLAAHVPAAQAEPVIAAVMGPRRDRPDETAATHRQAP